MITDIALVRRPSDPQQTIVDCVTVATLRGIRVTADPYPGVVLASTHVPTWERDPHSESVSALGAVLLVRQPAIAHIDVAIERALGVGPGWVAGFERGVMGHDLDERQKARPDARLLGQGLIAGQEIRARMHVRRLGGASGPARGLIEQLLDALSTSQGLEALANSFRRRGLDLDADPAAELRVIEETLRHLADEASGSGV